MKTTKTCKVVMLPTEKDSDLFIHNPTEVLRYKGHQSELEGIVNKQHLYITSDEEIKEGDWFINEQYFISNKAELEIWQHNGEVKPSSNPKKIIATTDKSLRFVKDHVHYNFLPQIPESFIKAYVEAQGNIKEVNVEYEEQVIRTGNVGRKNYKSVYKVKTRSDNTIIIHPSRTYTKEDLKEAFDAGMNYWCSPETNPSFDTWIDKL
jgi:hypothetical protein